jgi:hypothetical protein
MLDEELQPVRWPDWPDYVVPPIRFDVATPHAVPTWGDLVRAIVARASEG